MKKFIFFLVVIVLTSQAHGEMQPYQIKFGQDCHDFSVNKVRPSVTGDTLTSEEYQDYCSGILDNICKEFPYKKGQVISAFNQNNINKFFINNADITSDNLNKLCSDNVKKLAE